MIANAKISLLEVLYMKMLYSLQVCVSSSQRRKQIQGGTCYLSGRWEAPLSLTSVTSRASLSACNASRCCRHCGALLQWIAGHCCEAPVDNVLGGTSSVVGVCPPCLPLPCHPFHNNQHFRSHNLLQQLHSNPCCAVLLAQEFKRRD